MKTLVVGDLHLLGSIILPVVSEKIKELQTNRVILLGDYFDQWHQTTNINLYHQELMFLGNWVRQMRRDDIEVVLLLGNHDIPYLIGQLSHYSIHDMATVQEIKATLLALGVQIAVTVDDYLISHAGFAGDNQAEDWYFSTLSNDDLSELTNLENHVGKVRGGCYDFGSCVWADYIYELMHGYNKKYPKQIVGHTPVPSLTRNSDTGTIFCADTFSLYPNYQLIGNGDLLLIEDGNVSCVKTDIVDMIAQRPLFRKNEVMP